MDEILNALRRMVDEYRPTWHYEMGKVGHECNYCHIVTRERFDSMKEHKADCAWVAAARIVRKADALARIRAENEKKGA